MTRDVTRALWLAVFLEFLIVFVGMCTVSHEESVDVEDGNEEAF
jgi:hypothetical protein